MKIRFANILIIAAITAMSFAGCQKENSALTLSAFPEGFNGKLYIDNNDPTWVAGDQVSLNGATKSFTESRGGFVIHLQDNEVSENGYLAIYPASMMENYIQFYTSNIGGTAAAALNAARAYKSAYFNISSEQEYMEYASNHKQKIVMPMVATTVDVTDYEWSEEEGQDVPVISAYTPVGNGNQLYFYNFCSIIEVSVVNSTDDPIMIDAITITAEHSLAGDFSASWAIRTEPEMVSIGGHYTTTLNIPTPYRESLAVDATSSKTYSVVVPPSTSTDEENFCIKVHTTNDVWYERTVTKCLPRNTIASITVTAEDSEGPVDPPTPTEYYFSVGTNSYVQFSSGNLQYHHAGVNNVHWQFAQNQSDYLGTFGTDATGWVDLFSWGSCYASDPRTTTPGDLPTSDANFVDWATGVTIDGHNDWHSLSNTQMEYLIGRNAGALCKRVTVNGVYGLVLLPDNWNNTSLALSSTVSISQTDWSTWEESGAVFLPEAGYRNSSGSYEGSNVEGRYWTTHCGANSQHKGYYLQINASDVTVYYDFRQRCSSVRLVRDYSLPSSK